MPARTLLTECRLGAARAESSLAVVSQVALSSADASLMLCWEDSIHTHSASARADYPIYTSLAGMQGSLLTSKHSCPVAPPAVTRACH
jgi:hypothetical protein